MTIWQKTKWEVQSVEELKTQPPSWSTHLWQTYEQGYNVWCYKKTSGIYVATVWSRMKKKKKKTSEKEAQNQRVHNQVIVQTKADSKMCIREY